MEINVLIVDDEENSVEMLKQQVEWERFSIANVYGANSADEAREVMFRNQVQLLLCDIEMPGESGLEFIEWIREEKNLAQCNMECVILTCYPEYGFMRKAMQLGCSDYLLKPVEYKELYRVIEKAVRVIRDNQKEVQEQEAYSELDGGKHIGNIVYEKILPYIRENFAKSFSVKDIAAYAALNPQYTMRLFKKTTGMSILEYVTKERIEAAKSLLKNTVFNNDMIAEKVGYVSANYFIRQFKRNCGMTPREYRKKIKKENML